MLFAPVEEKMWEKSSSKRQKKMSDGEINDKYSSQENRILTEINREKLPSFAEALKKNGYMNVQPVYQRRPRWDDKMKSRLIESFLINIPVPPIILFEIDYNSYEVMDGQQRITAIKEFYENKLKLTGLELWPEINGRTYDQLPIKVKAGIDRRSISSIVIIAESTSDPETALFLKQKSFERFNTGGVDLSQQEVRNCLYHGKFNSLLLELSRNPIFTQSWGIPIDENDPDLLNNNLYKKMEDAELVLRFFALRNVDHFQRGMEGFLDLYMIKSSNFSDEDILILKEVFLKTINLAYQIYNDNLFKPFDPKSRTWKKDSYKAYYDAVMVGFNRHLDKTKILIDQKTKIIEETQKLFEREESRLLTGGGKSKAEIQQRIQIFDDMLSQVIGE
ncbi:hypothetical protein PCC9214_05234 [Planktothrix tepida]|uniref:GmrSD restriction endonucleases N-terminal domain-containing protein n=1 Tax=Planktothrix tepida PCC 9214 TaxID=671072 RepID=A0A1J1LJK7_9CYAN|nr:DUF262 domain-containing protein [Planktothrix tepida]CAD5984121.1 hypothetical protein PCC9214_05234 [Planktothrix tepida]CUR32218.1 conserved hypothetical protein [Planktothrix tepida PCC 9214]